MDDLTLADGWTTFKTLTMHEFDYIEFDKNLQEDFKDAQLLIGDIEIANWRSMNTDFENELADEEKYFNEARLAETLMQIELKLQFAYEYLALNRMSKKLNAQLKDYHGKYGKLNFEHYLDFFYSPVQSILHNHLKALTSHVKIKEKTEFEDRQDKMLLERILRGTAKMLTDRKIEPENEAQVRGEVYRTLIHVFPNTIREVPIAKVSKTYKPDIGVRKLKCAVEYKFVDSEEEAKTAIGGVFEDIQGYEGSKDWTTFYAVFYMTDNFLTVDQIEAEFELSKVPHSWKPIVVFGKGKRKKKK